MGVSIQPLTVQLRVQGQTQVRASPRAESQAMPPTAQSLPAAPCLFHLGLYCPLTIQSHPLEGKSKSVACCWKPSSSFCAQLEKIPKPSLGLPSPCMTLPHGPPGVLTQLDFFFLVFTTMRCIYLSIYSHVRLWSVSPASTGTQRGAGPRSLGFPLGPHLWEQGGGVGTSIA